MVKFFRAIGRLIKKLFNKKKLMSGNASYIYSRYISKKGADIIDGDIPVPTSDELQCTLFRNDQYTYVAMCIEEKFFFFIPWHYNEFIVKMNNYDINFDSCTAEDIVNIMYHATIWNKEDIMIPDTRYNDGEFVFFNQSGESTHEYDLGSNDYKFMKKKNVDD